MSIAGSQFGKRSDKLDLKHNFAVSLLLSADGSAGREGSAALCDRADGACRILQHLINNHPLPPVPAVTFLFSQLLYWRR